MAISSGDGSIILNTKVDTSGINKGFSSISEKAKKMGATVGKAFLAIGAAATAATVAIVKSSVEAYAEYEQLVGGVETLFKESAGKVLEYANEAFRTTGQSANEYMQNVTAFSASLLSAVGNDTKRAAEVANAAMISISDNVNKMGSSAESVQLAFQGFAKQQYMLLDNLKLGYGGTKTEMERLLKDAQAITGIEYNIDNLADVYTAIGVIQEKLGIAGTTAKEASTTISGSAATMKAAWKNVLAAISGGGDLDRAIKNLVNSVSNYFENIVPVIERALAGVGEFIAEVAPMLVQTVAKSLIQAIPSLVNAIFQMIVGLAKGIVQGIKALFTGESGTGSIANSISGIADTTDDASKGMAQLGNATEKAAKQAKRSLSSFDELEILTSNIASSSNEIGDVGLSFTNNAAGMQNGIGQGFISSLDGIEEKTETLTDKWNTFIYDVIGDVSMEKFANLNNSMLKLNSSAKKYADTWSLSLDIESLFAKAVERTADQMSGLATAAAGGLNVQASINTKDYQGVWEGIGTFAGGIAQMMPFLSEEQRDFFTPITEGIDNLYKGLSTEAAKALNDFGEKFNEVTLKINSIRWNGDIVSEGTVNTIVSELDETFDIVSKYVEDKKNDAFLALNELLQKGFIGEDEAKQIFNDTQTQYDAQVTQIEESQAKITQILENASKENRSLTDEEWKEINSLTSDAGQRSIATITATEAEREILLKKMREEEGKIDKVRLAEIIRFANDEYDAKVKAANDEYSQSVTAANVLYNDLGVIDDARYLEIIDNATRERDGKKTQAGLDRTAMINEAKLTAGEVSKYVDETSGTVLSQWEVYWNSAFGTVRNIINTIIDAINSLYLGWGTTINKISSFLPGSSYQVPILQIPKLAQGAVIPGNREFLAVLGDQPAGQTNIEAPLQTIVDAFNIALNDRSYDNQNEAILEIDGEKFGKIIYRLNKTESRRVGVNFSEVY